MVESLWMDLPGEEDIRDWLKSIIRGGGTSMMEEFGGWRVIVDVEDKEGLVTRGVWLVLGGFFKQ